MFKKPEEFLNPPEFIMNSNPIILSSFQAKTALKEAGLLETVQALIDHPDTPVRVKIAWQEGVSFRKDNPMVQMVIQQLEWTPEQVDALFNAGLQISPDILD